MRTVFIGAQEYPNGVNSYTFNLALELKKRGFESLVMGFGSCDKVTEYKGVLIKQYKTHGGTMSSIPTLYLKSIPYLIKHRKEIDIVMYQTVQFSVIPAFIVRLFGLKTSTSNNIMEAMNWCLPIVATNVGYNYKLVEETRNDFLTGVGDAEGLASKIQILILDKTLRYKMGKESNKHLRENYSMAVFKERYLNLITE